MNVCSKFQFNRSYRQTLLPVTARQKITKRRKQIKPHAQQPPVPKWHRGDFEKGAFSEHLKSDDFSTVREVTPVWVRSGSDGGVGRFCPIREVIYLGQLEAFTKEIRRFRNIYAAKTADSLVGVSGFEPEASWTRTKRDTKLRHTPIALIL